MNLASHKDCTGCMACYDACTHHAIAIKESMEGFWFPEIDSSACVNCNRCQYVCPVLQNISNDNRVPVDLKTFAAWSLNEELRRRSASGGIFAGLAQKILNDGGAVCGAAVDGRYVHHIIVESTEELSRLQNSKYRQSDMKGIYIRVQKLLNQGRNVLFSGCPCQVAALKTFLGKRAYNNLITLDLFCHGVPSNRLLEFLEWKDGIKIQKILTFRSKELLGCKGNFFSFLTADGDLRKTDMNSSFYNLAFGNALVLRDSCYHCRFAGINRFSDLTCGDFWGIRKYHNDLSEECAKGISAVVIHSPKGREILSQGRFNIMPVPLPEIIPGNPPFFRKFHILWLHPCRKKILSALKKENFSQDIVRYALLQFSGFNKLLYRFFIHINGLVYRIMRITINYRYIIVQRKIK